MNWSPSPACESDIPALEELIPLSVRILQAPYYSPAQMDAAIGPVFGVDRQLIRDGTYFVVDHDSQIVGCGGWSRRKTLYGGDRERFGEDEELDPNATLRASGHFLSIPTGHGAESGEPSSSHANAPRLRPAFEKQNLLPRWPVNRFMLHSAMLSRKNTKPQWQMA